MTIEHANAYLDILHDESVNLYRTYNGRPPKRQAKKLAKAALVSAACVRIGPIVTERALAGLPLVDNDEWDCFETEVQRLRVRVYDESIRLREIAEGKR